MCCKSCKNFLKGVVVIIFIIATFYFVIKEYLLGACFSFAFSLFFVLHFFETRIKFFKLGNLEIELQKSIQFNKKMALKCAEIILFLLQKPSGMYNLKEVTQKNKQIKDEFQQEILEMLLNFGYEEKEIEVLKSKYVKENN